jgi:hypothetical protein
MANLARMMGISAESGPTAQVPLTTLENTTQAMPCRTGELCQGVGAPAIAAPPEIAAAAGATMGGGASKVLPGSPARFQFNAQFSGDLLRQLTLTRVSEVPVQITTAAEKFLLGRQGFPFGFAQLAPIPRDLLGDSLIAVAVDTVCELPYLQLQLSQQESSGARTSFKVTPQPGEIREQVPLPANGSAESGTFDPRVP